MNKTIQLLGITIFGAAMLAACGDDSVTGGGPAGGGPEAGNPPVGGDGNGGDGVGGDGVGGSGGSGPDFPPPPEPGAQIDRMGRPAINTALSGAFIQFSNAGVPQAADEATRGELQDDYNEDMTESGWGAANGPLFRANLAILDALDTGLDLGAGPTSNAAACMNQAAHSGSLTDPAAYNTLGLVALPDDRLFVNVGGAGCSAAAPASPLEGYLGVELNALGIANTGCGGRRPVDDVIEVTYSLLAIGLPAGFDDGIDPRTGQHPATFPYMADPATND